MFGVGSGIINFNAFSLLFAVVVPRHFTQNKCSSAILYVRFLATPATTLLLDFLRKPISLEATKTFPPDDEEKFLHFSVEIKARNYLFF